MNIDRKHSSDPQQLSRLKAQLHRIPEQHPVDRSTGPVVAKKLRLNWIRTVTGIAASIALVALLWPTKPTSNAPAPALAMEMLDELYELGYVSEEDFFEYIEPDSIEFAGGTLDADLFYNYFEDHDNYLLDL